MSRVQICLLVGVFGGWIVLSKSCKIDNEPKEPKAPANLKVILHQQLLSDEPPITEEEAERFANELERAFAEQDQAKAEGIIRLNELVERWISDLNPSRSFIAEIRSLNTGVFSENVIRQIKAGSDYKLLRIKIVAGRPRPLFRLLPLEGGVNYHEYVLARDESGKPAIKDVYVAFAGEYLSETMRLSFLPKIKQVNNPRAKLTPTEQGYLDNLPTISVMTESFKSKSNCTQALDAFRKMPSEVQAIKFVHLCAIMIAMEVNEDEYVVEVEKFRNNHPHNLASDVVSIDYFVLKKKYKQALSSIDRLQSWTGGDDYLQNLKSVILAESEQKPKKQQTEKR